MRRALFFSCACSGSEDLSCQKRESRVEKKGPPGYQESKDVTGDPLAVKAESATVVACLPICAMRTMFWQKALFLVQVSGKAHSND